MKSETRNSRNNLHIRFNLILFTFIIISTNSCKISTSSYKEGKFLFETYCSSCHGKNAEGLGQWYPPLTDSSYILNHRTQLAAWIRQGIGRDSNTVFKGRYLQVEMPANKTIADVEICNILNYLNEIHWHGKLFTIDEIKASLIQNKN
ncbi:MAG: cytochrome c [Saprospiraceae bacterium]